jgi:hypothetical protein
MTAAVALGLTNAEFRTLHAACDKARRGSKSVTVDKAILLKLLIDHSRVLAALGPKGTVEPPTIEELLE